MAATAPLPGADQGRARTRYAAPATTATTSKAVSGTTTPVVRDAGLLPQPRLRCRDNAVLSDGRPCDGGSARVPPRAAGQRHDRPGRHQPSAPAGALVADRHG